MTQLALMRELLAAFSGNELVLGVVLGNWLLLMGLGAWLGRAAEKAPQPLIVLAVMQILLALLPLAQVFLLRALRNVIFIRGAAVGVTETVLSAFVLLLPYCLVAGAALTVACSLLARQAGSAGAGRVYVADSLGSILGGALFSFLFVRWFDHLGILLFPALLNLLAAAALGFGAGRKWLATIAGILTVLLVALAATVNLDSVSTALQYPRQRVIARANSPYGKLLVTGSDGQLDFIENGLPLTSTRDDQHVEEAVHYAMAQRPEAQRVLLVGGGIGGTAKELLKYPVRRVDYVELDPAILEFGRRYLPQNLADPRIRIINADGRQFVRGTDEKYEAVIIDVPAPATAQLNRFFTAEFFAEVKRALAPDGVVSFALGHYENYVSPELARMLASAAQTLKPSFRHLLILPGGQVFVLASDGPLYGDIASRLDQAGIQTKWMTRHYLDATLTADRLADMQRALTQPAALNTDFSPVLYYYQLRHWLSQFQSGIGVFQILLLVAPALYVVCLRGAAMVLFASGFAATALQMVLLLAFQVLCGSVYHQVGIIVTVSMAGLALGAACSNRRPAASVLPAGRSATGLGNGAPVSDVARFQTPAIEPGQRPALHSGGSRLEGSGRSLPLPSDYTLLARLALAVAGYGVLLPLLLPVLHHVSEVTASGWCVQSAVAVLALLLAVLVGLQFPVANRLDFDGTATGASRLYCADFIGAFLGALLAGAMLIPLIGVTGVCLLTAALNLLAALLFRLARQNARG
jgi:spermidine synthase